MCQHDDLVIDRLEILFQPKYQDLADQVTEDINIVSPETEVRHHYIEFDDPWDFEMVYAALHDTQKSSINDSHGLRQYLKEFGLTFDGIQRGEVN